MSNQFENNVPTAKFTSATCFMCEEYYKRDVNSAMTLVPCGHIACKPCIESWRKQNNTCPQCRKAIQKVIINRGLMDLIEENKNNKNDKINPHHNEEKDNGIKQEKEIITPRHTVYDNTTTLFKKLSTTKDRSKETINDKSEFVIYIIDNSKSMEYYNDGKIFKRNGSDAIIKKQGVLRWHEACSKIEKIAKYNISRRICASYYLLNPAKPSKKSTCSWSNILPFGIGSGCDISEWQENVDFVVIDPHNCDDIVLAQKYKILVQNLLCEDNVRGDTPLDVITRYFGHNLSKFIDIERYKNKAICYNIITDGEPNDKKKFEKELRYLANNYNIFLVINLCTESDDIVAYYNDLDTKIGKELSGCDVIDDLESEQKEIISAGNTFFIYSEDIHICRMAGCYSIIGDLMDEQTLSVYHACKLCNELCGIQRSEDVPGFNDRKKYIKCIKRMVDGKPKVYDYGQRQFGSIVDVEKVNRMIWINEPTENGWDYIYKMIVYFGSNNQILVVCIVVLLCALWLTKS